MGNIVEETGRHSLINAIMDHPSNSGRDTHTIRALFRVLEGKSLEKLQRILDGLNNGGSLPDHF